MQGAIGREKLSACGDDPASFYTGKQRCFMEKLSGPQLGESSGAVLLLSLENTL